MALLAGLLLPIGSDERARARETRARSDLAAIAEALSRHREREGGWPASSAERGGVLPVGALASLFRDAGRRAGWQGPYLRDDATAPRSLATASSPAGAAPSRRDPWGREYCVLAPADLSRARAIAVASAGPDGVLETSLARALSGGRGGDDLVEIVAAGAAPSGVIR
jgi:type II secretory pathway pseudopilin PulG